MQRLCAGTLFALNSLLGFHATFLLDRSDLAQPQGRNHKWSLRGSEEQATEPGVPLAPCDPGTRHSEEDNLYWTSYFYFQENMYIHDNVKKKTFNFILCFNGKCIFLV